jgi:hypothetical protein
MKGSFIAARMQKGSFIAKPACKIIGGFNVLKGNLQDMRASVDPD